TSGSQRPLRADPGERYVAHDGGVADDPSPAPAGPLSLLHELWIGARSDDDDFVTGCRGGWPEARLGAVGGNPWVPREPFEQHPEISRRAGRLQPRPADHDAAAFANAVPGLGGGQARDLISHRDR